MDHSKQKILLVILLALSIAVATAVTLDTQNQDTTDSQTLTVATEDEYDLSVITEQPQNVKETEADFRATVDQLDPDFDAALIYWNYSQDSSLDQKGPANIVTQNNFDGSETVESFTSGLEPETSYDVEAYAEPIVWDDDTLADNFIEKGLIDEERRSDGIVEDADTMEAVADDVDMMEGVADDINARTIVLSGPHVVDTVWSNEVGSEAIWEEGDLEFDGAEGIWSLNVDFESVSKLNVWTKQGEATDYTEIRVDGDTLFSTSSEHGWTKRELDVTGYQGVLELELVGADTYNPGVEYEMVDDSEFGGKSISFHQEGWPSRFHRFSAIQID